VSAPRLSCNSIESDGAVTPVAGSGNRGFDDGAAASFDAPCGVAVDANGNIYVADTGNGAVRVISAAGVVSTFWLMIGLARM
jgi:DNA-binding beta-propeller fold protein YncE